MEKLHTDQSGSLKKITLFARNVVVAVITTTPEQPDGFRQSKGLGIRDGLSLSMDIMKFKGMMMAHYDCEGCGANIRRPCSEGCPEKLKRECKDTPGTVELLLHYSSEMFRSAKVMKDQDFDAEIIDGNQSVAKTLAEAAAEIERLREALEYYADGIGYSETVDNGSIFE